MGNNNSKIYVQNCIDNISKSLKFTLYQKSFNKLNPSMELYFDNEDLIVETVGDGEYSINIYEFDWLKPDIQTEVYRELDILYQELVLKRTVPEKIIDLNEIVEKQKETDEITEEISEETYNKHRIYNFISDSISENLELEPWLNKYFDSNSETLKQLKDNKVLGNLWLRLFRQVAKNNLTFERDDENYLMKFNNRPIVILKEINGEYKFMNVPEECLNHLRNIVSKM